MPFSKRALGFFRGLARHNEKPWFEAHRDEYEALLPLGRWLNGALGFKPATRR